MEGLFSLFVVIDLDLLKVWLIELRVLEAQSTIGGLWASISVIIVLSNLTANVYYFRDSLRLKEYQLNNNLYWE